LQGPAPDVEPLAETADVEPEKAAEHRIDALAEALLRTFGADPQQKRVPLALETEDVAASVSVMAEMK
jgi:hypothetical protein